MGNVANLSMSSAHNSFESEQASEMQRMRSELRAKDHLLEDLSAQVDLRSAELQESYAIIHQLNAEHQPMQNLQLKRNDGPIHEARIQLMRTRHAKTIQELELAERKCIELQSRVEELLIEKFINKDARERLDATEEFIKQLHFRQHIPTSQFSTLMDIIAGPRGEGFQEFLQIIPETSKNNH